MNKYYITILTILYTAVCFGQKINEGQVPEQVVNAFKMKFQSASDVKWEKEDFAYSAEFVIDDARTKAAFDTNGVWVSTEWDVPIEYTPQAIKNYLDSAYAGYTLKKLTYSDLSNEGKVYIAEVNMKKDTYEVFFTLTGVFKRSKKVVVSN